MHHPKLIIYTLPRSSKFRKFFLTPRDFYSITTFTEGKVSVTPIRTFVLGGMDGAYKTSLRPRTPPLLTPPHAAAPCLTQRAHKWTGVAQGPATPWPQVRVPTCY